MGWPPAGRHLWSQRRPRGTQLGLGPRAGRRVLLEIFEETELGKHDRKESLTRNPDVRNAGLHAALEDVHLRLVPGSTTKLEEIEIDWGY